MRLLNRVLRIASTNKDYIKDFSSILSSTVIVQLLPFLIIPIITRKIDEFETGLYFTWVSLSISLTIILGGKLDLAILNCETRKESIKVIQLSFFFSIFIIPVLLILYYSSRIFDIELGKIDTMIPFMIYLFLNSIASNIINGIFSYQISQSNFKKYNFSRIIQSFLINGLILIPLISNSTTSASSLISFHTIGTLISLFIIIPYSKLLLEIIRLSRINYYWKLLIEYKNFPKFSLPGELFNSISNNIPYLFILSKYDPIYLGYYAVISKTLTAPIGIISNSFLSIYKRDSSKEIKESGKCQSSYNNLVKTLCFIGLPTFILLFLLLPDLFIWLYGERYEMAGNIAIVLLPLFFFRFIASPLSYTFFITDNQKTDFYWQLLLLLSLLGCFTVTDNFENAILAYMINYSILYVINLIYSYKYSREKYENSYN